MSTLEMERGGDVVVHHHAVQTVPDHVPADVVAEHLDAASVVARRPDRPIPVRVVDRDQPRSRAGLVLALGACALVAALVGGGSSDAPEPVRVRATTPPAATTASTATTMTTAADPACAPVPLTSPFGPSSAALREPVARTHRNTSVVDQVTASPAPSACGNRDAARAPSAASSSASSGAGTAL